MCAWGSDGEAGGENWEPQLLPALSGLLKQRRWLWRGEGVGGRDEGQGESKKEFGWQPCSLFHTKIRRSSEREMPLCSKTSLLPPQTVAAGIQAH